MWNVWDSFKGCIWSSKSGEVPTMLQTTTNKTKVNQHKKGREGGNSIRITDNTLRKNRSFCEAKNSFFSKNSFTILFLIYSCLTFFWQYLTSSQNTKDGWHHNICHIFFYNFHCVNHIWVVFFKKEKSIGQMEIHHTLLWELAEKQISINLISVHNCEWSNRKNI